MMCRNRGGALAFAALLAGACGKDSLPPTEPADTEVVLSAVTPDSLVEGQSATLTGLGFSPLPGDNHVTVDGAAATVTAASATSVTITVPSTQCRPARTVELRVAVGRSSSEPLEHPLRPGTYVDLPVGKQLIVREPSEFCLHFAESTVDEAYLVGVQSIAEQVNSLTPVTVAAVGAPRAVAVASLAPPRPAIGRGLGRADPLLESPQAARWRRHFAAENRLRDLEETFFTDRIARMGAASQEAAQSLELVPSLPPTARVGDTVRVRVPVWWSVGDFTWATTVVRLIGARGIWLEDLENPGGAYPTADLQALSDLFDGVVYATDAEYFGEPTDFDAGVIAARVRVLAQHYVGAGILTAAEGQALIDAAQKVIDELSGA
jgi:hypothetical protein